MAHSRHGRDGASTGWFGSTWPTIRVGVTFCLLLSVFYVGYALFAQTGLFHGYLAGLAYLCGGTWELLGYQVTVTDNYITSPTFSFKIVQGCDGLEIAGFFGASVFASPVPLRSRVVFALSGTVFLLGLNVVRIVSLACIETHFPKWFNAVHWDVWPGILIVTILLGWLVWARFALRRHRTFAYASH